MLICTVCSLRRKINKEDTLQTNTKNLASATPEVAAQRFIKSRYNAMYRYTSLTFSRTLCHSFRTVYLLCDLRPAWFAVSPKFNHPSSHINFSHLPKSYFSACKTIAIISLLRNGQMFLMKANYVLEYWIWDLVSSDATFE